MLVQLLKVLIWEPQTLLDFLDIIFQNGVLKYFDAISVHPFRSGKPETVLPDYAKLINAIKTANPNKPQGIISGAWGWTTCGPCTPDSSLQIALATQGPFLARQWLTNTLASIGISIYYTWQDSPNSPNDPEANFGTVQAGNTYAPKLGFIAAQTLQTYLAPTTYTFRTRVDVGNPSVYVLAYSRVGDSAFSAYAVWRTDPSSTCANIPAAQRSDCGYTNITFAECTSYRECCYDDASTPSCYFQQTSQTTSFNSSNSKAGVCFTVVNYLGNPISNNLCQQNSMLTVTASDGPLYLIANPS